MLVQITNKNINYDLWTKNPNSKLNITVSFASRASSAAFILAIESFSLFLPKQQQPPIKIYIKTDLNNSTAFSILREKIMKEKKKS